MANFGKERLTPMKWWPQWSLVNFSVAGGSYCGDELAGHVAHCGSTRGREARAYCLSNT